MRLRNRESCTQMDRSWIGQHSLQARSEPPRSSEQPTLSLACSKSPFARGPDGMPLAESSEPVEEGVRNELGTEVSINPPFSSNAEAHRQSSD
jgi:hypothetical protein